MARHGRGAAAFGIALAILFLLVVWNTAAGAGEVSFRQPYEPSLWRVWESRKSARHPQDILWARAGQLLHVQHEARVDRGTAELTVRGLLTGPATPLVAHVIRGSGSDAVQVAVPASGFYRLKVTSDLGAFSGQVHVRWALD